MYERALRGYKDALGLERVETYTPALRTIFYKGRLYVKQGDLIKARDAFSRALLGFQTIFGSSSDTCQKIKAELEALDTLSGESWCHNDLPTRELTSSNRS